MIRPALIATFALTAVGAAQAAAHRPDGVEVTGAWSRPAVAGLNGVGYLTIANPGPRPAVLVKVDSPLARDVQIHRSMTTGGVTSMSAAPRVEAPAGGQVVFAPGGYHLMFVGLKTTLRAGDRLPATLTFADGRRVAVAFAVGLGPPSVGHSDAPPVAGAERSQFVTKK